MLINANKMIRKPSLKVRKSLVFVAAFIILAVLMVFAIRWIYNSEINQSSVSNPNSNPSLHSLQETLHLEKIEKQSQGLDQVREASNAKGYSPEELKQQSQKLDDLRAQIVK